MCRAFASMWQRGNISSARCQAYCPTCSPGERSATGRKPTNENENWKMECSVGSWSKYLAPKNKRCWRSYVVAELPHTCRGNRTYDFAGNGHRHGAQQEGAGINVFQPRRCTRNNKTSSARDKQHHVYAVLHGRNLQRPTMLSKVWTRDCRVQRKDRLRMRNCKMAQCYETLEKITEKEAK